MQEIYNNKIYEDAGGNSSTRIEGHIRTISHTPFLIDDTYRYNFGGQSITPILDRVNISLDITTIKGQNPYTNSPVFLGSRHLSLSYNATNNPQGGKRAVFDIPEADIQIVICLNVMNYGTHYRVKPYYQYAILGYSTSKPVKVELDLFNLTGVTVSKTIDGIEYSIKTIKPLYLGVYSLYQATK